MSRVIIHTPLSIANRLFLVFLFGMVVVIGGLILLKKTPLHAQIHPVEQAVVVHITDQTLSIQSAHPQPRHTEAVEPVQH